MVAADLHQIILKVINNVTLRIISLISDNTIININSFKLLSGTDVLKPYINNPVNREDKCIFYSTPYMYLKTLCKEKIIIMNLAKTNK